MEQPKDKTPKYNSPQITDLIQVLRNKWQWIAASLILSLCITGYLLNKVSPRYERSASILIKDETKGGNIGAAADAIADLGLFQSRVNIQNELLAIQAPIIILETVKRLELYETYSIKKGLKYIDLYQKSPLCLVMPDKQNNVDITCTLSLTSDSTFVITDLYQNEELVSRSTLEGNLGDTLSTEIGRIQVLPTSFIDEQYIGESIYYSNIPEIIAANALSKKLKFELGNKMATIIDLSIHDSSIKRGDDILNTVIQLYGEAWIKDKNQIAESTSEFINDRLKLIERELGNVDDDISTYKSDNLLPDASAVSNKYLEQSSKNDAQILALSTQLSIAKYIKEYMQKPSRQEQLIPANSGIDTKVEMQIAEYNTILLERNLLIANSSRKNPLVTDMDQSLASMRKAILTSIDDVVEIIEIQLDKVHQSESVTRRKISQNPKQVKYLLSVERQQKIKETLYLFLLQKREENELTYAFTAYNTRIISPPMGNIIPVFPNYIKFLLVAAIIGLALPCLLFLIIETLNPTVKSRKDLQILSIPIIGEIPWVGKRRWKLLWAKKKPKEEMKIIINSTSRNQANEAFRIVRTNIDFMLEDHQQGAVMMVTSANPDSGKTFITSNLAISMGIKGAKVLIIDLDLRKATISALVNSPRTGISDYLAGKQKSIDELIVRSNVNDNLDILPVGKIPPNPSELLSSPRLRELIAELRTGYDYILLDCTPIDIVADAAIVNKVSDTTIFVIRGGLFELQDLHYIQELYDSMTYNNIRIVLNNSDVYGKYGYGYSRYGYGRHGGGNSIYGIVQK